MAGVTYGDGSNLAPHELVQFYERLQHDLPANPDQIRTMLASSTAFVTARVDGRLIGIARGVSDGVRGYFAECKLDPAYQGPAAVTRTDGRIEHDAHGIAAEMSRRVLDELSASGVARIDVIAHGTEIDFLRDLGFRGNGAIVGMSVKTAEWSAAHAATAS